MLRSGSDDGAGVCYVVVRLSCCSGGSGEVVVMSLEVMVVAAMVVGGWDGTRVFVSNCLVDNDQ